ncbi:P-loop ATPase of the PilT family [Methanopyrus kandleri AV19]|uniref:P-loop ATPase of the PilT family n=2 Tax=Methanopyrus kandleri TaxID=2320 RepID=Q8TV62_METKA|nr:PINc/VapC family ATPase [Methanopyrus kandleri]AAM02749.1 P-loop ATPase of the PilT family [Methanopyrus kandleri AV19]
MNATRGEGVGSMDVEIETEYVVPDTSVVIDGRISRLAEEGYLEGKIVVIPRAVLSELEYQANRGRETGFAGLQELQELQRLAEEGIIEIEFAGERPGLEEIRLARSGEIDAMIREVAREYNATLITSDKVQAEVAKAEGLEVVYFEPITRVGETEIERMMPENAMSLHLKENVPPKAKVGRPGEWKLIELRPEPCTREELEKWAREVIEKAYTDEKSFVEIDRGGATVVQLRNLRISIARPPFSEGWEITAVRPVVKVSLDDYDLSEKLKERLRERAEGILVAGPPGSGKSTFCAALAEFYAEQGKIVKTMESPRDLQVGDEITQYAPLDGDMEKTADILLLVRPDYTIYDEVRKTKDFEVFADMRLAGVGMIGVVHATRPIDAIQRLIGRVELGVIPQVVDTVIFIEDGEIKKVYDVSLTVKVPTGMTEEDLARPVVEIRDFETGELEYEIYTYGEEVFVVPVKGEEEQETASERLAAEVVEREVRRFIGGRAPVDVEVKGSQATVYVPEHMVPMVIGKKGRNVEQIEHRTGLKITVKPLEERRGERPQPAGSPVPEGEGEVIEVESGERFPMRVVDDGEYIRLQLGDKFSGRPVKVFVGDEYVFTATVGSSGEVRVNKDTSVGQRLEEALHKGLKVRAQTIP